MTCDGFDPFFEAAAPLLKARIPPRTGRRPVSEAPTNVLDAHNPLYGQPLPRWTRFDNAGSLDQAAFAAGAALFALDQIFRSDPPWLGAFRMRQALTAATVSSRLLRRREDEADLRDAHHLPSDDPGPVGRLHRAWRTLATRPTRLDQTALDRLAERLGLEPMLGRDFLDRIEAAKGNPVMVAANVVARVANVVPGREGEVFGLMLADVVLAARFGWAVPVPLLATAIVGLKVGSDGHRPRPSDPGWTIACHAAYARAVADAHARALDVMRRAEQLLAVANKVRTRGGGAGILALLGDDAVAATALKTLGSERAARRFLARLVELGAIREVSGRKTFRLYGL